MTIEQGEAIKTLLSEQKPAARHLQHGELPLGIREKFLSSEFCSAHFGDTEDTIVVRLEVGGIGRKDDETRTYAKKTSKTGEIYWALVSCRHFENRSR